ncbi:MAG: DNA primase, partial [Bifidobacteriaceae bacterium]|nr:DNA primase [Bifidobacteriaceae bacterium]
MAGRILREDIDAVRASADIQQVVGERVNLKRAGVGSMMGLCPFHDEKTPSFHIRPQLGLWHCFGCGEGGDTIAFVMKADGLGFAEAVEYLAGRFGLRLRYEDGGAGRPGAGGDGDAPRRLRLLEANRLAAAFYTEQLATPAARAARDFLRSRQFDRLVAEQFGVGFAPTAWDGLVRHLRGRGFTDAELAAAGLASPGRMGPVDRFRNRLVWPVRDLTGATVGFGARRLDDSETGPKYLNTPETALYHKSQLLYGADLAKRAIAANRRIVVVEGYTDVMAAHLSGVEETVATCGTAFGPDHIRVVRRLLGDVGSPAAGVQMSDGVSVGGKVVFTFDGDEAGQKAALKAFGEEQRFYAGTFVAIAPGGRDPCELWVADGPSAVRELVDSAEPMFKWAVRTALKSVDLDTAEGRVAGLRLAAPVVAGIRDDALRRDYTRLLAGWVGQDEALVRREVAQARRNRRGPTSRGGGR